MSPPATYTGGCHCGAVRYEVTADISTVISCNCSICAKRGHLLAFAPLSDFRLLSSAGATIDYQFNKKKIHHHFCSTCGVGSYGLCIRPDGKEMVAINVRCLDGVDSAGLTIKYFDGRSL
jgi:hypothetical protein